MMHLTRRAGIALVAMLFVLTACGEDDSLPPTHAGAGTATPAASATGISSNAEPEPPAELRVAFINLLSPLVVDENNRAAEETYDERLSALIAELLAFDPDIVGFNEASWTKSHGWAVSRLQKELKMEAKYVRSNPQFPNVTKDEADDLVKKVGFEEGELILVRGSRFPVLSSTTKNLNPGTSESGEKRGALHVVVKGHEAVGDIDIFITHLTGGGDAIRAAQATDFAIWVNGQRGSGPAIIMVGQSDPLAASTYPWYKNVGLIDVSDGAGLPTCCRLGIVGEQPELTVRSDYLMSAGWTPVSFRLFGEKPTKRADAEGTLLYASDHNGLMATFSLVAPPPAP